MRYVHSSKLFQAAALMIAIAVAIALVLPGAAAHGAATTDAEAAALKSAPGQIQAQAGPAVEPDPGGPVSFSNSQVQPSADQKAASQAAQAMIEKAWAGRTENTTPNEKHPVAGPMGGAETGTAPVSAAGPAVVDPNAAPPQSTFYFYRDALLSPGSSDSINESTSIQTGKFVLGTGNWHVERSADGGGTWSYFSPYADFASFCCDQDTVQDPGRNLMLWTRLGVPGTPAGQNYLRVSESTNGFASWCNYSIIPTTLNGAWTSQWFDYPKVTVTASNLYTTANMFDFSGNWLRMIIIRWPLDSLAACSSVGLTYWYSSDGWTWEPIQGNRDTLWLGDTYSSAGTFRVYGLPDANTTLSYWNKTVPAWTFTNRNGTCTVPNGKNPCARPDQRVTGGWLANGVLGFFWNVKEGGGFTYPYVEAATFIVSGMTYYTRPYIYNGSFAFQYASAAPNSRMYWGISGLMAGGGYYPYWYIGIFDDYTASAPPGWEIAWVRGSNAWGYNDWGDYNSTRQFGPSGNLWTASGWTDQSGAYQPEYVVFGRARDWNSWFYWYNK